MTHNEAVQILKDLYHSVYVNNSDDIFVHGAKYMEALDHSMRVIQYRVKRNNKDKNKGKR